MDFKHSESQSSYNNSESSRKEYVVREIELFNSFIRDADVKRSKFKEMGHSPFAFYRATAHLFYRDIFHSVIPIPPEWKSTPKISTWIQGDLHLKNFGFFDNDKGEIKFDINDFDESYIAPFYWDIIRFTIGIFLIRKLVEDFNLSNSESEDIIDEFIDEYKEMLKEIRKNSKEKTLEFKEDKLEGFLKEKFKKVRKQENEDLLKKWTTIDESEIKFDFKNPDLEEISILHYSNIVKAWLNYINNNKDLIDSKGKNYLEIKSIAKRKNSGLGSLGVNKYYLLLNGNSDSNSDKIILELKEQKLPSLFLSGELSEDKYNSQFENHAQRACFATKALLLNADDFLGTIEIEQVWYLVRKISHFKSSVDVDDFKSYGDLKNYTKYCAKVIALAHSRTDEDNKKGFIDYKFEKNALEAIDDWKGFRKKIKEISEFYANKVENDFHLFQTDLKEKNIL